MLFHVPPALGKLSVAPGPRRRRASSSYARAALFIDLCYFAGQQKAACVTRVGLGDGSAALAKALRRCIGKTMFATVHEVAASPRCML